MDIYLLIGLIGFTVSYFGSKRNAKWTPLYSLSVLNLFTTSLYLIYRYGTQEPAGNSAIAYLFTGLLLFVTSIILMIVQIRKKDQNGLKVFFIRLEKKWSLSRFNSFWLGINLQLLIILLVWFFISMGSKPEENLEFAEYYALVDHFFWQFYYVLPLVLFSMLMKLYRFSLGFFLSCLLYPVPAFLYPWFYSGALDFFQNFFGR